MNKGSFFDFPLLRKLCRIVASPRRSRAGTRGDCHRIKALIRDELAHSDSVLIPENTLQSFLGTSSGELGMAASDLANENGWMVRCNPDRHCLFERKPA